MDDAVEGLVRVMLSDYAQPLNVGSDEMVLSLPLPGRATSIDSPIQPGLNFGAAPHPLQNIYQYAFGTSII